MATLWPLHILLVLSLVLLFEARNAAGAKAVNQVLQSDFVLGKDRELYHASIDLKWLCGVLLDKRTWLSLCSSVVEKIKRMNSDHDNKVTYKEDALDLLLNIRNYNEQTPLRVFHNALQTAHFLSTHKKRFIVYYIESGAVVNKITVDTANFRQSLANSDVGNLLNEQFLFMASTATHPYAAKVLENVSKDKMKSLAEAMKYRRFEGEQLNNDLQPLTTKLPMLVVLAPSVSIVPSSSLPFRRLFRREPELDVVACVSLKDGDITAQNIMRFLSGVIQNFGGRFVDEDSPDSALFSMHADPGV